MKQMKWSAWRLDRCYSASFPHYRRFQIVRTTAGYTVSDQTTGELARVTTFAAAKAWAGIRVGEQNVRHGQ